MRRFLFLSILANVILIVMYTDLLLIHWHTLDELENMHNEKVSLQTVYVNNVPYKVELEFEVTE